MSELQSPTANGRYANRRRVLAAGMLRAMNELIRNHVERMRGALSFLREDEIHSAVSLLHRARRDGATVFSCGNGGSAATAAHLAVDLARNTRAAGAPGLRVLCLADNVPWLTAVSNDRSYEECFAEPLANFARPGDVLIGISASGESENLVRAFDTARNRALDRLAIVGFDGGRLSRLATHRIWVESDDYGIVETAHLFIAHLLVVGLADSARHERIMRVADLADWTLAEGEATLVGDGIPVIPSHTFAVQMVESES